MIDEEVAHKLPVDSKQNQQSGENENTAARNESSGSEAGSANQLTPEEQMALYEKDLKENDWGHQPC